MKKITAFILVISVLFSQILVSAHWADEYFLRLQEEKIILGDEYGLRQDDPLLRCEFAAMLNRTFSFENVKEPVLIDVYQSDWYYNDFYTLSAAGIMTGDEQGKLNPKYPITRAEAAVMLARALNFPCDFSKSEDEEDIPSFAFNAVKSLKKENIITGYEDGKFHGNQLLLRGEAAVILVKAIELTDFTAGDGSELNPYIITNERQLAKINNNLEACYKLEADLYFTDISFPSIGDRNSSFQGIFDGNGHKIVVNRVNEGTNTLFKKLGKGAVVENLYVVCPKARFAISGTNNGLITKCAVTSWQGEGRDYSRYFGFFAQINEGTIDRCYNLSKVSLFDKSYVSGGIAGINNGKIKNCFNEGVTDKRAYGIAGENEGEIVNCFTLYGDIFGLGSGKEENVYSGERVKGNFFADAFTVTEERVMLSDMKFLSNEDFELYDGGDGSVLNPYRIKTQQNFLNISKNPDKAFIQTADISVNSAIPDFAGYYNGNGFSIKTLRLRDDDYNPIALFINNKGILNKIRVEDGLVIGRSDAGGIVYSNYGEISQSVYSGLVQGKSVGGICKTNNHGAVINECIFEGQTASDFGTGAICEENYGTISNVYTKGEVLGKTAGGIVHKNTGELSNCYFAGKIKDEFGGIAYNNYKNITSGYAMSKMAVNSDYGICTDVMVSINEYMQNKDSYRGFDFDSIWDFENGGYPTLKNVDAINNSANQNVIDFLGGSGTVTDPYRIATPAQLASVYKYPDANFMLMNDLDLTEMTRINPNFFVCEDFKGIFNGNKCTIMGFNPSQEKTALFIKNSGVITDLYIKDSRISGKDSAGFAIINNGIIRNCMFSGEIENGGAPIAYKNTNEISNCVADGEIKGETASGFVYENSGKINSSLSVADITADKALGIAKDDGGEITGSWYGGLILSKEIFPISDGKYKHSFYLDYYGLSSEDGKRMETPLDAVFEQDPWKWEKGLPVLKDMPYPSLSRFMLEGNGTEQEPYCIYDSTQLKFLGMYNDKCFRLMKNINLDGKGLVHINNFKGNFDGNGKTIFNFKISGMQGGLFGLLEGEVSNLTLSKFSIEGQEETGSIAAINKGTIKNCAALYGRIGTSGAVAGGIAGLNKGEGFITNCVNSSDVFSSESAGGICGKNEGMLILCGNRGGVIATAEARNAKSGGIVGDMTGVIDRCYNNGKILAYSETGKSISGGIAGFAEGTVLNSYNSGEITTKAKKYALSGGIIGSAENTIEITNAYNTGFINATSSEPSQGSAVGRAERGEINSFVYEHTLPEPVGKGDLAVNYVEAKPMDLMIREIGFEKFDFDKIWCFSYKNNYFYPQIKGNMQDELPLDENSKDFAGGDGTIENPYKIITPEQLNNVRKYLGATYMLLGDIDMTNYCENNEFLPIGDNVFSFFGLFVGNNFTISGLKFSGDDFGLFRENHGEIYNCFFEDVSGSGSGGTVAKYNTGLIYNCVNSGDQESTESVDNINRGGLVGINKGTGMIISSYNTGGILIVGENAQAGGLAYGNYGIISGSFNTGKISAIAEKLSVSGGICAGNFGVISDCYTAETSVSESIGQNQSFAGGIAGNNIGTVVNCYFNADAPAADKNGSISATNTGSMVNCYFTGNQAFMSNSGYAESMVLCTEYELMQKETFKNFDFDNMWIIDQSFNYKCPQFIEIAHRE